MIAKAQRIFPTLYSCFRDKIITSSDIVSTFADCSSFAESPVSPKLRAELIRWLSLLCTRSLACDSVMYSISTTGMGNRQRTAGHIDCMIFSASHIYF